MPSRNATTIQTHFLQFTKNTGDLGWSSLYYSVIDFADEVWRIALTTFDLNGATDDYQYINVLDGNLLDQLLLLRFILRKVR